MHGRYASGRKANAYHERNNSASPARFKQLVRKSLVHAATFETLHVKERQKREQRDVRRGRMTPVHDHLLMVIAKYLKLDIGMVTDFISDADEQITALDNFVKKRGTKTVLFFYQDVENTSMLARAMTSTSPAKPHKMTSTRLFITQPNSSIPLTGLALFFIRKSSTIELTLQNVSEDVCFGAIDSSEGLLNGIRRAIETVMKPAMGAQKYECIEPVCSSHQMKMDKTKGQLMEDIDGFVGYLKSTQICIDKILHLEQSYSINFTRIHTVADCSQIATCAEKTALVEQLVLRWCKQLENLLAASLRMRKEADTTGPFAELEHWRNLTASFNSVVHQIRGHDCKMALCILRMAKSKVLKKWHELDMRITDAANEARDNVKYLYTIERFFEPIYKGDPLAIDKSIPFLVNAINMIQSTSRYYNTSERMTSFFMKVTNQAVLSCKAFITNNGTTTIWDQDRSTMLGKLRTCYRLNQDYKISLQRVKHKTMEIKGSTQGFSERNVFGKLDAFHKRLEKIKYLLQTIDIYWPLVKCHIDSLGECATQFQIMVNLITHAEHNPLDYKKPDFDDDFEAFESSMDTLKSTIKFCMNKAIGQIRNSTEAIKKVKLFEQLKLPGVMFDDNYANILQIFGGELSATRSKYRKFKDDVPLARNMPPMAGKIYWARLMYRKIRQPMDLLSAHTILMKSEEGQKVVKTFNKTASFLLEFEYAYHKAWTASLEPIKDALRTSVFGKNTETGEIVVNFDPFLSETMRESEIMFKLGLELPKTAQLLYHKQRKHKHHRHQAEQLLSRFYGIINSVPPLLSDIIQQSVDNMKKVLRAGIIELTWGSVDLDKFLIEVDQELDEYEQFVEQVTDLKLYQIDEVIEQIKDWPLYKLPERETWTVEEILEYTNEHTQHCSKILDGKSRQIEESVNRLVALFAEQGGIKDVPAHNWIATAKMSEMDVHHILLWERSYNMHMHLNQKTTNAITRAVKSSLDMLRRRLTFASMLRAPKDSEFLSLPVFTVDIVIEDKNLIVQPTMKEIQQCVISISKMITEATKGIAQWGQSRFVFTSNQDLTSHRKSIVSTCQPIAPQTMKNYFKIVTEQKDVHKIILMLGSAITRFSEGVKKATEEFTKYQSLWCEDRDTVINKFLDGNPVQADFKRRISDFDELCLEIQAIPKEIVVGPISIHTDKMKEAMMTEISEWQSEYFNHLYEKYQPIVYDVTNFIEDKMKDLAKPVKTLDEVHEVMHALDEIRDNEVDIDMSLRPLEDAYQMLTSYGLTFASDEFNHVDSLRYNFNKLKNVATTVHGKLVELQPGLQVEFVKSLHKFCDRVNYFINEYEVYGPLAEGISAQEGGDVLNVFQNRFDELYHIYEKNYKGEKLFGLPITSYPPLIRIKKELQHLQTFYKFFNHAKKTMNEYGESLWKDTDIDVVEADLRDLKETSDKQPFAVKDWKAYRNLKSEIDLFVENCPVLKQIATTDLMQRHWDRIAHVCDRAVDIESEIFCLRDILNLNLVDYKEHIEDVCISATKEHNIEEKLKAVIDLWSSTSLKFSHFKQRGEIVLKTAETSELIAMLEDHLVNLHSLMNNRYNVHFKKQIQSWSNNLLTALDIIEDWIHVQSSWIYLEEIFSCRDIASKLPQEAKRFKGVDSSWVKIMHRAHDVPNVITCCVFDDTLPDLLPHMLEQLEICQKSLNSYLDLKRMIFPRFFFISDPVLLEILGHASDPKTIEHHLGSLFANLSCLIYKDNNINNRITDILSREGERLAITAGHVAPKGNVEEWLGDLLSKQRKSLRSLIADAYFEICVESSINIIHFVEDSLCQVATVGLQLAWTKWSEEALNNSRYDRKSLSLTNRKFNDMLNKLILVITQDITDLERQKMECVITVHIHQRDIFEEITKLDIRSVDNFEWQKRRRYYFKADTNNVLMAMTDAYFVYQDEFLGCMDRLVLTPLTDRCYITIAQALKMKIGAAPEGPAGTGKTETVKDVGKSVGQYVVVFNCSNQMDYRGLGKIFKGAAMSGSWVCYDEFNRINLDVLSAAAGQCYNIFTAMRELKPEFVFTDGSTLTLSQQCGVFTTMNPGYVGRQILPQNLKDQLRSIAMMVPDRQIIIRVRLASCGFMENANLAQKFDTLYKLCEEELSKQNHYDFGLRNVISVLRTLASKKISSSNETETDIVLKTLRVINLSKMTDEDEPLFLQLVENLFPTSKCDSPSYPTLSAAIAKNIEESNLINHGPWHMKIIQLYETSIVRHGIMILGPSGAGKSCCIETLAKSLTDTGQPHKNIKMNPKAITTCQMFGYLDVVSNDWTDGIFSTIWRRCLKIKKRDHTWWITFDGPVDVGWIENLNSVLDDNKRLTLANGDRLPMDPNCKVLFEVQNIHNASPATVSRNGMVYMSSSVLNWKPILDGWLKTRNQREVFVFADLFANVFEELYDYIVHYLKPKMQVLQCNYITQACNLLQALIPQYRYHQTRTKYHLEKLFTFSMLWSLGALLEEDERAKLQQNMEKFRGIINLPEKNENFFDYVVGSNGEWEHWSLHVPHDEDDDFSNREFGTINVPNIDGVRTTFLIKILNSQEKPVLLIGEQGTAKSLIIRTYLKTITSSSHIHKCFNFSAITTPSILQQTFENFVEKRVGNTYGPPGNRKMTLFIDDLSMPVINEWGDQATNELLRQIIEENGFYNLQRPGDFINIVDCQVLGAMIHPGGGRNDIPERLKRHFSLFNCPMPSNESIDGLYSAISAGYFRNGIFSEPVWQLADELVEATRHLLQRTKIKMMPTPAKFHYVFNLRDLSRIWGGMTQVRPKQCQDVLTMLKLWKHECTRVMADRFVCGEDKEWFEETINQIIKEDLKVDYEICDHDEYFIDFIRPDRRESVTYSKDYVSANINTIIEFLKESTKKYNESLDKLDMVVFKDCAIHVTRLSRILRTRGGSALLIGVEGSGKQYVSKLASFIAGYEFFRIQTSNTYNHANFVEDLRTLHKMTGLENRGITFFFGECDVKDEACLEYLNNMLGTGEVPNLFTGGDRESIAEAFIAEMKKETPQLIPQPADEDYDYEYTYDQYFKRVRNNLHIVLSFSCIGDSLRRRVLKFPKLLSGCSIDWYNRWPIDGLIDVATCYLEPLNLGIASESKGNVTLFVSQAYRDIHEVCQEYYGKFRRQTHMTPPSFLSYLEGYNKMYNEKYFILGNLLNRVEIGLDKFNEATQALDYLSKELEFKERDLALANEKADAVLHVVTTNAQEAELVKVTVENVKNRAETLVHKIQTDKLIAEKKLEAVKPSVDAAEAALLTIKPTHIATVKKLPKPPHLIMRIMDCALLLFQKKLDPVVQDPVMPCPKPSWSESLKLLSNTGFLTSLINFPKDQINEEIVELMAPYLKMSDYSYANAKKVCGDVSGLLSWTVAMVAFYKVNNEVLPLKANLAILESKFGQASTELNTARRLLDEKEEQLLQTQILYADAENEKQRLQSEAANCKRKSQMACMLIDGLIGEKERWTVQREEFTTRIQNLVGDAALATAFLTYAGPFNREFRNVLYSSWLERLGTLSIPHTKSLKMVNFFIDMCKRIEWHVHGLPYDDHSLENAIIVKNASRYPLIIDPQGQGRNWIQKMERDNDMQTTSIGHRYFRNHLEDCLSLGRPVLVENIGEEIDIVFSHVLQKNFIPNGIIHKVQIEDRFCDVMSGFFLYLTTTLPNPNFSPKISAMTSIVDFTVTQKGLEDQLLARVLEAEKKELEMTKVALMEDIARNKSKMKELEDDMLSKLTSTKGSLVDDATLSQVLQRTQMTAVEIGEKIQISEVTQENINKAREQFRPVASRGSLLYFLICDMNMVNYMYQTSINQFLRLFDMSLALSKKTPITYSRVINITEYMTETIFKYTIRGLYDTHKFVFAILLAIKLDMKLGIVTPEELDMLIYGGANLDLNSVTIKPYSCNWIDDESWLNLALLEKNNKFKGILSVIENHEKIWKIWFDRPAPELEPIPCGYDYFNNFSKLLLIRALCPERFVSQARIYIRSSLGETFSEPMALDLEQTWEESTNRTPLICLLSTGANPTNQIVALARKHQVECKTMSMGQGQEVQVRTMIKSCMASGGWVLIQNCHLGLNFLDDLYELITEESNVHTTCRVWITTHEDKRFSRNLLQCSIKFTNEQPFQISSALKRSVENITDDLLQFSDMAPWKPLVYAVSFLHGAVQKRCKYGTLGWSTPYEFANSDWHVTMTFLKNHIDDVDPRKGVSWETIRYMIGHVLFGGKVTDDFDKRLLLTFIDLWFGDQLLKPSFRFCKELCMPENLNTHAAIEQHVNTLPTTETPQVVGLHQNAGIFYQRLLTKEVLNTIINIQPKHEKSFGETKESIVYTHAEEMLSKLPQEFDEHEMKDQLKSMGMLQPLNIFLKQEISCMQHLLRLVKTNLTDLQLAIDGNIVMDSNLRDAFDNISNANVPKTWEVLSWGSVSIGFWMIDLIERFKQLFKWVYHGRPMMFWMSGFFNPQGFLTTVRQEATSAHKGWELDSVKLHNEILKVYKEDIKAPPPEGVYVHGLFLEGASWDRKNCRLAECQAKSTTSKLPVVLFVAVNSIINCDFKIYLCPLYKSPKRTNFTYLTCLAMKTIPDPKLWILRGVAALCSTS